MHLASRIAARLLGAAAALAAPALIAGGGLRRLLPPPGAGTGPAAGPRPGMPDPHVVLALATATGLVARLSRYQHRGSPWRNTCLYRSVAECLVLRAYGRRAWVRVGAGRAAARDGAAAPAGPAAIAAHAWVEHAGGERTEPPAAGFVPFASPRGGWPGSAAAP